MLGGGSAAAATTVKASHGGGFCNLGIFLSHSRQIAKENGVEIEFVATPTFADQVTLFGAGQVDMSIIPYTNFLTLRDAGAPVTIIAGGGVEGCVIVAQPGLDSAEKLKGKTLGTFQADTLEILPYDWLKKNNIPFSEVQVRYMGTTPETVEAFVAGALDWICTIEPYGQTALQRVPGAVMLSDGRDIYGKYYPDCVLAARTDLLQSNPAAVKAVIKGMFQAQYEAEYNREAVLEVTHRHLLQDHDRECAHCLRQAAGDGRYAPCHRLHPRSRQFAAGDRLHQGAAQPQCHRLDAARGGDRRES